MWDWYTVYGNKQKEEGGYYTTTLGKSRQLRHISGIQAIKKTRNTLKTEECSQRCKNDIYHYQSTDWIKKREIHIVRANACPHYAIILALIAESTMNKGIGRKYESMRAKMKKNFYGENYKSCSSRGGILNWCIHDWTVLSWTVKYKF